MAAKALVRFKVRRVLARILAEFHPDFGAVVEITGRGRGAAVYAMVRGEEQEFTAGELDELDAAAAAAAAL